MLFSVLVTVLASAIPLISAATPYSYMRAHRRGDCQVYTVQSGDWCDKIATSNGISLVQLQQFNPSLNCNTIAPGDRLCLSWGSLPAPPSSQPNPDGTCKTATVQPGDWCDKIATGNGITLQQLQQYNSALNCAAIIAGQRLCITPGKLPDPPTPPANPDGTCQTYDVVFGDSCSVLPNKCRLTLEAFNLLNPTIDCSKLSIGQRFCCSKGTKPSRAPKPIGDNCAPYSVVAGDSCSTIAGTHDITVEQIEDWNTKTFHWLGCSKLQSPMNICLSPGNPPAPPIDEKVQCGPQSKGNLECPLKACCGAWGYCGLTDDFCKPTPAGLPCISNCELPTLPSGASGKEFRHKVGYYAGWGAWRTCNPITPEDLNVRGYTHLIYAFAVIGNDNRLSFSDSRDIDLARRLVARKRDNPYLKVSVAVGGWAFSQDDPTKDRFSRVFANDDSRLTFVASVIEMLGVYGFDGIDLDYEYPASIERGGTAEDTTSFSKLMKELRAALGPRYTLSAALPAGYWFLKGYETGPLVEYSDFLNVMSYDFHGQWDASDAGKWDPNAYFKASPHTSIKDIQDSTLLYLKAGIPLHKVNLGIAFYGRTYKLDNPSCGHYGCAMSAGGSPGRCTGASGYLGYFEIDEMLKSGATAQFDAETQTKYIIQGGDLISYDDLSTWRAKIEYAKDKGYGGYMTWAMDLVDGSVEDDLNTIFDPVGGAKPDAPKLEYAISRIEVVNHDAGSPNQDRSTGVVLDGVTEPFIDGHGGFKRASDVNQGIGGDDVGIYVYYDKIKPDAVMITDVRVEHFGCGGGWDSYTCADGYERADGSVRGHKAALTAGTKGSCWCNGLCVKKQKVSDVGRGQLLTSLGLVKYTNNDSPKIPTGFALDEIDIHMACKDDNVFKLTKQTQPVQAKEGNDDDFVITDVVVVDMGAGSPPAGYTGVRVGSISRPFVPSDNVGTFFPANDVNEGVGGATVGIFVKYEPLSGSTDRLIVTDILVNKFGSSTWNPQCPPGYFVASGSVRNVPGALSAGTKGACDKTGLCVRKKKIQDMTNKDLYVQSSAISKHSNSNRPWLPGLTWIPDELDIHSGCKDDYTFLIVNNYRVLPNLRPKAELSRTEMAAALRTYAPVVYLHEDEKYFPSSISSFFSQTHRVWDDKEKWCQFPTEGDLDSDLPLYMGQKDLDNVPVYAFWSRKDVNVVDHYYFKFYPFNFGKVIAGTIFGNHIGDWEHVTVRLIDGAPAGVYLPYHEWGTNHKWMAFNIDGGTHPVAYSAVGSHGTHARPGTINYLNYFVGHLKDECSKGPRWETWKALEGFYVGSEKAALPGNKENTVFPPAFSGGYDNKALVGEVGPIHRWGIPYEFGHCSTVIPIPVPPFVAPIPFRCKFETGPSGPDEKGLWGTGPTEEF